MQAKMGGDIGLLIDSETPDKDESEKLYLKLAIINENGENIVIPENIKINSNISSLNGNNWEIESGPLMT